MPANATRRQIIVLAATLTALVVIAVYQFSGRTAPAQPARPAAGPARPVQARDAAPTEIPDVKLEALTRTPPEPVDRGRNLFRERPKAPPPPPPSAVRAPAANVPAPPPDPNAPPPPPPPPPPITLKFIGVVRSGGVAVAVLSDGRDVFYGREGEVIEGRFRIIRVGVESVEMSYLDGRGRRTIPLSGG